MDLTPTECETIRTADNTLESLLEWVGIVSPLREAVTELIGELEMVRDIAGIS